MIALRHLIQKSRSEPSLITFDNLAASASNFLPQLAFLRATATDLRTFTLGWALLTAFQSIVRASVGERSLHTQETKSLKFLAFDYRLAAGLLVAASLAVQNIFLTAVLIAPALGIFELRRYSLLGSSLRKALSLDLVWLIWSIGLAIFLILAPVIPSPDQVLMLWIAPAALMNLLRVEDATSEKATNNRSSKTSHLAFDAALGAALGYLNIFSIGALLSAQDFAYFRSSHLLAGPLVVIAPSAAVWILRKKSTNRSNGYKAALVLSLLGVLWYLSISAGLVIAGDPLSNLPRTDNRIFLAVAAWQIAYLASAALIPEVRHSNGRNAAALRVGVGALLLLPLLFLRQSVGMWLISYVATAILAFVLIERLYSKLDWSWKS